MAGASKKVKTVCVVQVGSSARCEKSQVQSLKALGLGRIGKSSVLKNDSCTVGLIKKVRHLLRVEGENE